MSNVTSTSQVRTLAFALPEVTSAPHFDREAFKVGRIFATLGGETLNLMLTPELQDELLAVLGTAAEPCAGGWGRNGSTAVRYADVAAEDLQEWLGRAWRTKAPKKTLAAYDR